MPKTVKIYWGRIIFALAFLPAAIGLTYVLISCFQRFSSLYVPFLLGVICYTLTYPVFKKPLSSYVIGHELTHVLGIWLSRGKIHSIRIAKSGGMVKADRINIWTALLPYFFPIYTVIILGVYFLLSIFLDMSRFYNWMVFILGLTWAFHFWMTIYVLRYNQPDIRYSGFLFSMVVIFTINIITLTLLLTFISPELSIGEFVKQSFLRIKESYIWILKRLH